MALPMASARSFCQGKERQDHGRHDPGAARRTAQKSGRATVATVATRSSARIWMERPPGMGTWMFHRRPVSMETPVGAWTPGRDSSSVSVENWTQSRSGMEHAPPERKEGGEDQGGADEEAAGHGM